MRLISENKNRETYFMAVHNKHLNYEMNDSWLMAADLQELTLILAASTFHPQQTEDPNKTTSSSESTNESRMFSKQTPSSLTAPSDPFMRTTNRIKLI